MRTNSFERLLEPLIVANDQSKAWRTREACPGRAMSHPANAMRNKIMNVDSFVGQATEGHVRMSVLVVAGWVGNPGPDLLDEGSKVGKT